MENHFFPECGKTCQDSKFKLKVKESRRNASAQAQKHSDQFMYRLQSLSAPTDLHKLPVKQTFESWRDAVRRSTSQSTQTRHGAEQSLGIKCLPTGRATDTILTWEAGGTEQVPGLHRTEPLQLLRLSKWEKRQTQAAQPFCRFLQYWLAWNLFSPSVAKNSNKNEIQFQLIHRAKH